MKQKRFYLGSDGDQNDKDFRISSTKKVGRHPKLSVRSHVAIGTSFDRRIFRSWPSLLRALCSLLSDVIFRLVTGENYPQAWVAPHMWYWDRSVAPRPAVSRDRF